MARKRKPHKRPALTGARFTSADIAAWLFFLVGVGFVARLALQTPALPQRLGPPEPVVEVAREAVRPAAVAAPSPRADQRTAPPPAPPIDLLRAGRSQRPVATTGRPGRVAIIIDDIGNDLGAAERASRLPFPITFAVIPYLAHSLAAAELLNRRGFELMLHQPMEPVSYPKTDPGRGAILEGMPDQQIRQMVRDNLAAVPYIRGLNNHMGSRVTQNASTMRPVLESLVGTGYFFVDSRTIASSVAAQIARELHIPTAERTVFLDAKVDRQAVRRELRRLVRLARERGSAIAIGHPHPETLEVLADELPDFARQGIELVFASALVS